MRRVAVVLLFSTFALSAHAQDWAGFTPVDATTMPDFENYRTHNPNGYRSAAGDFDGDGRVDSAGFYLRGGELLLALRLAASPENPVVIWNGRPDEARYVGVETATPGTYPTACRRYWQCEQAQRTEVRLTYDGILFWAFEGPASFLYFRTESGGFEDELITE